MKPPTDEHNYRPLVLPRKGADLLPGRQYWLPPIARAIIADVYGIRDIPSVVECILKAVPESVVETITTNLETGEYRVSRMHLPAQRATFRAFYSLRRVLKVELNLEFMWERQAETADAHKMPVSGELRHGWLEVPDPEREAEILRLKSASGLTSRRPATAGGKAAKAAPAVTVDLSLFQL